MTQKALFLIWSLLLSSPIYAANLPTGFVEELLVDNLNPVAMTIDHHSNIWIVEKDGVVRIVDHHGDLLPDPFIQLNVDAYNERGLLGIALHPDFDNSPYVYLYYTVPAANHNRVSRFLANGNLAVPGSEEVLLDLDPLAGFVHNGGAMLFGPDSMLYIATGEAAHPPYSQDLTSLHGKILRIRSDGSIPSDNPFFASSSGTARAIWALGLRNPFSLAIDPATQDIYSIDVGGGEFEEINHLKAGRNYGWPSIEGPINGQNPPSDYEDPLYAYDHNLGCSIVGAAFNPLPLGTFSDAYDGHFFFADYCEGYIKSYHPANGQVQLFADQINRPLAIAFDPEERKMYYLTRDGIGGGSAQDNTSTQQGQLWVVQFTGDGKPFISVQPSSTLISFGEDARFQIKASGLDPLSYQWFQNGQKISDAESPVLDIVSPSLSDSGSLVWCVVSNDEGSDTSKSAILNVTTNQRPEPVIDAPLAGSTFRAGDTLYFSGKAIDPEEGELGPENLSWLVVWHHDEHTHPGAGPFVQVSEGFWVVPTVNETDTNVWYRVHLIAKDEVGLTRTSTLDIHPELAEIHLHGPSGVEVNIDGKIRTLPHTFHSLIGLQRIVEALPTTVIGDNIYRFEQWSDGERNPFWTGNIPEAGLTLSLLYEEFILGQGSGLLGTYYNDSSLGFETTPVLERLDTVINFLWGNESPEKDVVNRDFFTARWEGDLQAIFDEVHTFSTRSDDGVRLWIGDELVIDQWIPQAPTVHSGDVLLEAGTRYPMVLEYFEKDGGAEMVLEWSSPSIPTSFIPVRQLYPKFDQLQAAVQGRIWLDENRNLSFDPEEVALAGMMVLLKRLEDSSLVTQVLSDSLGAYRFSEIVPGNYFLQFLDQSANVRLQAAGELDLFGRSQAFSLEEGVTHFVPAPFFLPDPDWILPFPDLQIYPSPAEDALTLEFIQASPGTIQASILNMTGQIVLTEQWKTFGDIQTHTLELRELITGIYLLRLQNNRGIVMKKFMKG